MMAAKGQLTGMQGVYVAAAELSRQGFIVSPTSRSAFGADLLVTDQRCRSAWSVQVKANATNRPYWLIGRAGREIHSRSHVYVFVTFSTKGKPPRFFVVPSNIVVKKATGKTWHRFERKEAEPYQDKWELFGHPD